MRTATVRVFRYALIGAIVIALGNVLFQILTTDELQIADADFDVSGGERIVNPRFNGRDEGGQPFLVTADAATRRDAGVGIADLDSPTLEYALLNNAQTEESSVLARSGVFDEYNRTLLLEDAVELTTNSGYALTTEKALIVLSEGRIEGNTFVRGTGPWGAITANAFEVSQEGDHIEFIGNVRTRLYAQARETETTPQGGEP
jgi:lipopolysaccharide export system protein LptC